MSSLSDVSPARRAAAFAVHLFTASGIFPAAFAMFELTKPTADPRLVFAWLLAATLIDALDGPLARHFHVKRLAPDIDGRTIDDLLDYLTFAFIPLMLIWRMQWLPSGVEWTVCLAMGASLLGFAHSGAKDEARGFFRGFPSYWNIFALYAGILSTLFSPWITAALLWLLTIATVSPIWLIYPNLAPRPWKAWILLGAVLWTMLILVMLWTFPRPPLWLFGLSLIYPAFYTGASWWLRRPSRTGFQPVQKES